MYVGIIFSYVINIRYILSYIYSRLCYKYMAINSRMGSKVG